MMRFYFYALFGFIIFGFCCDFGYSAGEVTTLIDSSSSSTTSSGSLPISSTSSTIPSSSSTISSSSPIISSTISSSSPTIPSSSSTISSSSSTSTSSSSISTSSTTVSPITSTTVSPCQGLYGTTANTTDPTCQAYMICIPLESGYKIYRMKCPNKLVFRPSTRTCVTTAMYPCTQTG